MPNVIHTALLEGKWLSAEHTTGTVRILSDSTGLNNVREDQMKNSLAILRTPQFWTAANSRKNFVNAEARNDCKLDCGNGENFPENYLFNPIPVLDFCT